MDRRHYLSLSSVALAGLSGCTGDPSGIISDNDSVSPNTDSNTTVDSDESNYSDSSDDSTNESTDEDGQSSVEEVIDLPVIEDMSVRSDESWLYLSRAYKTPNYADEFTMLEQWTIESDDITIEEENENDIEPETESDVVLVGLSILSLNRWGNNIQTGDYDVTLVLEAPNGDTSEPASESISITEQASQ
ncbi:hypothetical protein [Halorubrum sp. Atlit-26R]|uniref:hypothetical protein n=1 Tax=Halorubrum sp. Atlit-26R TaxID=2282128 RepID=UPI0011C4676E|nr:hypothetical protein [Halorubrum sp. Atlit-26R]